MPDHPVIELKTIAPYGIDPIWIARFCREHIAGLFNIFDTSLPLPVEKVLKDERYDERLDSATMIYRTEFNIEWVTASSVLRIQSLNDDILSSPCKLVFDLAFTSKDREFHFESTTVFAEPPDYAQHIHYYLDNRVAGVTSSGLTGDQLLKLAAFLRFPPVLLNRS